ncbi:MAG: hypothetical protein ABI647_01710 [Gemmatimonadota bacterium]
MTALPKERDEGHLRYAMGWETANIHLGSSTARTILADLKARPKNWLSSAAKWMAAQVEEDWQDWRT